MAEKRKLKTNDRIEDAFECWAIMAEDTGDYLAYEYVIQYLNKQEQDLFKQRLVSIGANI